MNYDKKMEEIISSFNGEVKKLLLHSCCAPCSSHVIETLTPYFDITIIYYNPNIEPYEEYEKRKKEEIRFINEFPHQNKIDIIDCDYDNDKYHTIIKGLESEREGGPRCFKCYYSQKLNEIGAELEEKYGIPYLYSDFKKKNGYKRSIELSKEYNLYRQDYCGCIYSRKEREQKKDS